MQCGKFEGDKYVTVLIMLIVSGMYTIVEMYHRVHFKYVQFIVHWLYLNNAALKKNEMWILLIFNVCLCARSNSGLRSISGLTCDGGHEFHMICSLLPNMSPELQLLDGCKNEIFLM